MTTPELKVVEGNKGRSLMRVLSTLVQRALLSSRLGLTHEGNRDLYEVFGYKATLSPSDFLGKYTRQDIASRVVDAFPNATWSNPPVVTGNQRFTKAWKDIDVQFRVWQVLQRLDRLLGLGEYAVLFLGIQDGLPSSSPAKFSGSKQKLIYMQPYGQASMAITAYDEDPRSPRYGLPLEYEIRAQDISKEKSTTTPTPDATFQRKAVKVHWSRTIHIVEDPLENEVFGVPRLQRVYNLLDDLLKVCGGTAETYWITANRGMQANIDKDMTLTEADANELSDEIDEYQHQLRRFIRTRGVEITPLGSDVPDPRGVFDILVTMLSGSLGIPKRILLGSEAGQLASEQDRTNWANRIEERRANFAEPYVLYPFFNRLLDLNILPAGPQQIMWPSAFRMSPFEKAQTSAQKARSAANLQKIVDSQRKAQVESETSGQTTPDTTDPETGETIPGSTSPTISAPEEALLTRDEMRRIILGDDLERNDLLDEAGDISRSET